MESMREVVIPDFYGLGRHIYKENLGFRPEMKEEARTPIPREIFRAMVEECRYHLGFYDPVTDQFYGVRTEDWPIPIVVMERNRDASPYIGYQCEGDPDACGGEVLMTFERVEDIWDNTVIDGVPLEEMIARSYITSFT